MPAVPDPINQIIGLASSIDPNKPDKGQLIAYLKASTYIFASCADARQPELTGRLAIFVKGQASFFTLSTSTTAADDGTEATPVIEDGVGNKFLRQSSGGAIFASGVTFVAAGGISSTDVQSALEEVDAEKAAIDDLALVAFSGASADVIYDGQIPFPATQNPSADPNTLDDYEEGTFTPTFNATGVSGVTTSAATGQYTKIGNVVFYNLSLNLSSKGTGGSGNISIGGFPFTAGSIAAKAIIQCINVALGVNYTQFLLLIAASGVTATVTTIGNNVASASVAWADCSNTSAFRATGFYFV